MEIYEGVEMGPFQAMLMREEAERAARSRPKPINPVELKANVKPYSDEALVIGFETGQLTYEGESSVELDIEYETGILKVSLSREFFIDVGVKLQNHYARYTDTSDEKIAFMIVRQISMEVVGNDVEKVVVRYNSLNRHEKVPPIDGLFRFVKEDEPIVKYVEELVATKQGFCLEEMNSTESSVDDSLIVNKDVIVEEHENGLLIKGRSVSDRGADNPKAMMEKSVILSKEFVESIGSLFDYIKDNPIYMADLQFRFLHSKAKEKGERNPLKVADNQMFDLQGGANSFYGGNKDIEEGNFFIPFESNPIRRGRIKDGTSSFIDVEVVLNNLHDIDKTLINWCFDFKSVKL